MKRKYLNKKGMTLVEIITSLVIIGVSISIFYSVFFMNWGAFEQYIAQADLGQDLNQIVEKFSVNGRLAKTMNISSSASQKQVSFLDANGGVFVTYTMNSDGTFTASNQGSASVTSLTNKLDFNNSNFTQSAGSNKAIVLTLALADQVLGKTVKLNSSIEVYLRNSV